MGFAVNMWLRPVLIVVKGKDGRRWKSCTNCMKTCVSSGIVPVLVWNGFWFAGWMRKKVETEYGKEMNKEIFKPAVVTVGVGKVEIGR
jgi:hypothetical protein